MDTKAKVALAVVAGVVIGVTLLGGALAVPVALHAAGRVFFTADDEEHMSGSGAMGGGMMGPDFQGDSESDGADTWFSVPRREGMGPGDGEFGPPRDGGPPCGGAPGACPQCPRSVEPTGTSS